MLTLGSCASLNCRNQMLTRGFIAAVEYEALCVATVDPWAVSTIAPSTLNCHLKGRVSNFGVSIGFLFSLLLSASHIFPSHLALAFGL